MIKIGIVGYGNLGRGVECALQFCPDMSLVGIFTRRNPQCVKSHTNVSVYKEEELFNMQGQIDVLILCGGSAKDLPLQSRKWAKYYHIVDSFDTHEKINAHYDAVDKSCLENKHVGIISVGWDPGLNSMNRLLFESILPLGMSYTFWGKGVSQGHSDAVRQIDGVLDARAYTLPIEESLNRVRQGENPILTPRQRHLRECFVVAKESANKEEIKQKIKTMPSYFCEYETRVYFVTQEELNTNHQKLNHGGIVLRSGTTGFEKEHKCVMEYKLKLDSNPEFTSSVLVAYARAAYRLASLGQFGCKTVFDIPPALLHVESGEDLRKKIL